MAVRDYPAAACRTLEAALRLGQRGNPEPNLRIAAAVAAALSGNVSSSTCPSLPAADAAAAGGCHQELFSLVVTMQKAAAAQVENPLSLAVAVACVKLCGQLPALGDPRQMLLQAWSLVLLGQLMQQLHDNQQQPHQQQQESDQGQNQQQQQQQQPTLDHLYNCVSPELLQDWHSQTVSALQSLTVALPVRLLALQLPGQPDAAAAAVQQLQQQCEQLGAALLPGQLQAIAVKDVLWCQQSLGQNAHNTATEEPGRRQAQQQQQQQQQQRREVVEGDGTSGGPQSASSNEQAMDLQEFHQKLIHMISKEAAQQMQRLGVALAAQLPTNLCCCNPACTNVHMPSEVQLVGGKACVCSGCKATRFCSRTCLQQC
jgi:hypothetical protein